MRRTSHLVRTVLKSSRTRLNPPLARTKPPKEPNVGSTQPDRPSSRVHKRLASSQPVIDEQNSDQTVLAASDSPPESDPPTEPAPEKPLARRLRISPSTLSRDSDDRPQLPPGLDILWVPDSPPNSTALPPPELFEEALTNLHIALHPQTQHRAAYSSPAGPPIEPTLALYCPVEGGEYVLDETVRELARRTGAEVLVIDSVHLAAGEWGHFGKAANAIQLPRNPLHYHPAPPPSPSRRFPPVAEGEEEAEPSFFTPAGISQMTLHVLAPVAASRGRPSSVFAPSRSSPTPSRIKAFFDELINIPSPSTSESSQPQRVRPRIVYIRDFPTLAPTAPTWYPHLLSAVRARRTGPIARPSSPVTCPMTIVCGVTPPLVGTSSLALSAFPGPFSMPVGAQVPSSSGPVSSRRRHTARSGPVIPGSSTGSNIGPTYVQPSSEWGEDDYATRARERRLRERLRRWERHGDAALLEDVPRLFTSSPPGYSPFSSAGASVSSQAIAQPPPADLDASRPPILLLGGGTSPFLDMLGSGQGDTEEGNPAGGPSGKFFRASVILPSSRDQGAERECRMTRRREVNELAMRLGVGGIGGVLEAGAKGVADSASTEGVEVAAEIEQIEKESVPTHAEVNGEIVVSFTDAEHQPDINAPPSTGLQYPEEHEMWEDWSTRVEPWSSIRQIADRAVGTVVSSSIIFLAVSPSTSSKSLGATLEPTSVPWSAIHHAWAAQRSSRDLRRAWSKDARLRIPRENQPDDATEDELDAFELEDGEEGKPIDEVVEKVRQDEDLDTHEKRLLGCIVDPATLPTTFAQVHLPPHTIDSVRTLVSLPLLYPVAFQTGILKEHAMTGCLLFGPPGTGKTLVVRALAKEAGCRMLMVSPSDVMDMYVGEGEKLVKAVFSLARRLSPCVVFLDEIDALFGARSSARESGGAMAHRGVITEFMQEMDGLKSQSGVEERVVVIGATNRPFDLDDAVLRRLPRRLLVDLPGEKEREGILRILLRDETLASDVDVKALARQTESFSGSDLKHLCVSAALDAVKEGVSVPWRSSPEAPTQDTQTDNADTSAPDLGTAYSRTIHLRHFTKALKEITPSSSESLGSLSDLRKWNEQFGEGQREKRRIQVWGKGKFGFVDPSLGAGQDEGRVAEPRAMARRSVSIDE
ncbi:AAA-domain-containing protein [Imleria badia]|nr:AAA-domain-containing protein [Imleria badia]